MTVYVKTWCPWCVEALDWLRRHQVEFQAVDVMADPPAYAHMRKISGQSLTPTLEMPDGAVLADFDVEALADFLKKRGLV